VAVHAPPELGPALARRIATVDACGVCNEPPPEIGASSMGAASDRLADWLDRHAIDAVLYVPSAESTTNAVPDLVRAGAVLGACATARVRRVALVSSAAAYGASSHHPGLIRETRAAPLASSPIARAWVALELLATDRLPREA